MITPLVYSIISNTIHVASVLWCGSVNMWWMGRSSNSGSSEKTWCLMDRGFNLSMSGFWRILYCPVRTIGLSFCASITVTPNMFVFTFLAVQACASARWECMGTSVTTAAQASRTSAARGANLVNAIIIAATATHSQVSRPHAHNISSKITYSWTSVSRKFMLTIQLVI